MTFLFVAIIIAEFLAMDVSILSLAMHWKTMPVSQDIHNLIHCVHERRNIYLSP